MKCVRRSRVMKVTVVFEDQIAIFFFFSLSMLWMEKKAKNSLLGAIIDDDDDDDDGRILKLTFFILPFYWFVLLMLLIKLIHVCVWMTKTGHSSRRKLSRSIKVANLQYNPFGHHFRCCLFRTWQTN